MHFKGKGSRTARRNLESEMNKNPACAHLLVGRLTEFAHRAQASLQNCFKFKMSFFGKKIK